jgi:hypothetical protein
MKVATSGPTEDEPLEGFMIVTFYLTQSKLELGGTLQVNCRCAVDQWFTDGREEIDATQ